MSSRAANFARSVPPFKFQVAIQAVLVPYTFRTVRSSASILVRSCQIGVGTAFSGRPRGANNGKQRISFCSASDSRTFVVLKVVVVIATEESRPLWAV